METSKGYGYCGLACGICSENADCPGCRNEGCPEREWCRPYQCGKKQGWAGCWVCPDFPCDDPMLAKLRVRAFARMLGEFGEEQMSEWLVRNERAGMMYHYPGELTGDYDQAADEEEIRRLVMQGRVEP